MRLTFLVFFSILFLIKISYSQDLHLSQFYTNKMNLNPALAGNYKGNLQFSGNYRSQWKEAGFPLNTVFIALDKKMFHYSDEFSVGFLLNDDEFAGFNQKVTKLLLNGSYSKRFGTHKISAGIQLGPVFRSTDLTKQTFPNQWVYQKGIFDQSIYNKEKNLNSNQWFFDATLGFLWQKQFGKLSPTVGITVFHINKPKDTYGDLFNVERLRMRKSLYAALDWQLDNDIVIEPKLLYMWTTKSQDLVVGSNFKKNLNSESIRNIYAGVLVRTGFGRNLDAIVPTIGFGIKKFDIGFSYDINVSSLSYNNNRKSTLEWSLVYTTPIFNPSKLSIPCDRY